MKTNIKILSDVHQSQIKRGDVGYIDGYVQAADRRGYAVVVIPAKKIIDLVSVTQLEFTGIE